MACVIRDGHEAVGVDVSADMVAALAADRSRIVEAGLDAFPASAAESASAPLEADVELNLGFVE